MATTLTQALSMIETATPAEKRQIAELAIGRLLALGARPFQPGDHDEYDRLRAIVMRVGA